MGTKSFLRAMEMLKFSFRKMIVQPCKLTTVHQIISLKWVNSLIYKLPLNKTLFQGRIDLNFFLFNIPVDSPCYSKSL